ncbi:BON domain-containing protein [Chitinilyticum piscinae]|uniref:BON domain-containing protein n=1 Tax=Chitinilyticum piscinae TaxID=2866724 RepID=A0A8J7FNU0_9NEIS|nr:BON domain-containing protein [Chitinilyticum piscinae]MBE9610231.1 BON domain-containing protein [Chitinilyticum piscinae]
MLKRALLLAAAVSSIGLTACVPLLVVGGVAVGAWIGSDPRKTALIEKDTNSGATISAKIIDTWKEKAHVNVTVYNGVALLTGEVPDSEARQKIEQISREDQRIRQVINETVIAPPSSAGERLNDSQLTTRVKTAILTEGGDAQSVHILVVTERKVVYLMGLSTPELANKAAISASKVGGVQQVVKLVEYRPPAPN